MEKQEKKSINFVYWIVIALLAAGTIVTFVFSDALYGSTSWFIDNTIESESLKAFVQIIPSIIKTITLVFIAYILILLIRVSTDFIFKKASNKAKTIMTLTRSFTKWAIIIATIFLSLQAFGVNTVTLLAGLGIIALVVGLGAQSLINDIIAGFFIVFEEEFKVGDIVIIDNWRGTVTEIGIRMTRFTDIGGNIKIVNNSDIRTLINQTQQLSVPFIRINIDYNEDLNRVENVIKNNLEKIKKNVPAIIEGPFYQGVSKLGESSVELLLTCKCSEEDYYQVERDVNRELFLIFRENSILIPFNQLVVTPRNEAEPTPSKEEK